MLGRLLICGHAWACYSETLWIRHHVAESMLTTPVISRAVLSIHAELGSDQAADGKHAR